MNALRILTISFFAAILLVPSLSDSDSAAPVGKKVYLSENGHYRLTVDPQREFFSEPVIPLLTLDLHSEGQVWTRRAGDFEGFRFPLHVCVSNDGQYFVFGGYSAHNYKDYEEGLRFYDADGHLIRFVSRLDLPPGEYGISTAAWYDSERSMIKENAFLFFTPGNDNPLRFSVETGELLEGKLISGQGDDENGFMEFRRKLIEGTQGKSEVRRH